MLYLEDEDDFQAFPLTLNFNSYEVSEIILNEKEMQSENENFIQEKNIKYSLYPLYINWKKIESKNLDNVIHYNIFKLFGYFGAAIFNILAESSIYDLDYFSYENFLFELNSFYVKYFSESQIKNSDFFKKIINIYDDVISLIKNKIIIFKEICVFIIVMKLYQTYFSKIKDSKKLFEVIKYQYIIISYLKEDEYKLIYNKYLKKLNRKSSFDILFNSHIYPKNKKKFINNLKIIYKDINKESLGHKNEKEKTTIKKD